MHANPIVASPRSGRRSALLLCAVLAVGCTAARDGLDTAPPSDTAPFLDTDSTDTCTETGETDAPPAWIRLSAVVLVEDGIPVADESTLHVSMLGTEADGFPEICAEAWTVSSIATAALPGEAVLAWWQVVPGAQDGTCKDRSLPSSLHLGVGTLHPDVAALLPSQGWTSAQDVLYGAYVQLPDPGDVWTYGYAWTREGVDSGTPARVAPPLPDGSWQLVPVYLLPA
ncbi:MAG: hypothetical protein JXB39_05765 [Deltaproteobacteria bacterium]|nr:hypothetical protein [Deltaproteobacteria bacterium]